jgi:hypothetical protein
MNSFLCPPRRTKEESLEEEPQSGAKFIKNIVGYTLLFSTWTILKPSGSCAGPSIADTPLFR